MEDSALKAGEGRIVQMGKAKINLDMAVFPNVLSSNDVENNYFKVLVSTFDDNDRRSFTIDKIHLDFYRKGSKVAINILKRLPTALSKVGYGHL